MATLLRVLLVEDDPDDAELIVEELRRASFDAHVDRVETEADLVNSLGPDVDVVLADYTLPQFSAPDALEVLKQRKIDVPLIVVTGSVGEDSAVRCMRSGAADYLLKDRLTRLGPAIRRALAARRARHDRHQALAALEQSELRHRAIAQLASDFAYFMRALPSGEHVCEWLSGSFTRITGFSTEQVETSADWMRLVHEDDRGLLRRHVRRLREGQADDVELRIVTYGGRVRHMLVRGCPSVDPTTMQVVGFFGAARDITQRHRAERIARLLASSMEQTTESMLITTANQDGPGPRIVFVNSAFTQMTGYTSADIRGQSPQVLQGPKTDQAVIRQLRLAMARGESFTCQTVNYRKDGREILVEWRIAPIKDSSGTTTHYVAVHSDVTERERMARALRESEERYALAARGANDGLWDWDLRSDKLYLSDRWREIVGTADQEPTEDPAEWLNRIEPLDLAEFQSCLDALTDGRQEQLHVETRMLSAEGEPRWMLVRGAVCRDEEQRSHRLAGSITDITERKKAEAALAHDALHDALTGLPNRALLVDRVESALTRARRRHDRPVALLAIGLDRFELVNDTLGHTAGDEMLRTIARRFEGCVRASDTVARLGGDKFAVLLDEVAQPTDITVVADRLRTALADHFEVSGQSVYPSISVGAAADDGSTLSAEELLRNATTALTQAKERGRSCDELYDPSMHSHSVARLQVEADLRTAIERHELVLHYQPIVRATDGTPLALEALIRWNHPVRGLLPPTELIAVAEETGLIVQIGEWVAEHALEDLAEWDAAGFPPVRMAVNLSVHELLQENLVARVSRSLRHAGLPASRLELELTETLVMQNAGAATILLRDLRALGVHVAIDDFGTGYSSLAYLNDLPITSLKIDRSFVQKLGVHARAPKLIRTIVNLAHDLGLRTTAEGVETPEQRAALVDLKCDELQGYLFSRPVPMASLLQTVQVPAEKSAAPFSWATYLMRRR
jgi:diguanylate cyclase (GGDEF)-like protein/PAS domain S-box-containing protein